MRVLKQNLILLKGALQEITVLLKKGKIESDELREIINSDIPRYFVNIKHFFHEIDDIEEQSFELFESFRECEEKIDDLNDKIFNRAFKSNGVINLSELNESIDEIGSLIKKLDN